MAAEARESGSLRVKERRIRLLKRGAVSLFGMEGSNYYAVIPAEVRDEKRLSAGAKRHYGEIAAIGSNARAYCGKSNAYFAGLYQVSAATVSRWIKSLSNAGYISVTMTYRGKEIEERRIRPKKKPIPMKRNKAEGITKTQADSQGVSKTPEGISKTPGGITKTPKILIRVINTATTTAPAREAAADFSQNLSEKKQESAESAGKNAGLKAGLKELDKRLAMNAGFYEKAGKYLAAGPYTHLTLPQISRGEDRVVARCIKKKNHTAKT